eukprot:4362787-Pleurochrysis_carterae.AAC.1
MPKSNTTDTDSGKPSWDSSQFTQRAWIDDLLPWLPTCNAAHATLIEHGYTLTPQGRVVVHSYAHAQAVFFNQHTPYPLDSPSPVVPILSVLPRLPPPQRRPGRRHGQRRQAPRQ